MGAVIVRNKQILSTGYNGSPAGVVHCDDVGHEMIEGHCVRTIHAEQNAIIQAAKNGVTINGSEIYITHFPCYICFKLLANAGIKSIYYEDGYRIEEKIVKMAKSLGIVITQLQGEISVTLMGEAEKKKDDHTLATFHDQVERRQYYAD